MEGPFHWIKEHPVTLALGLGGLLLVFVIMRAAGGGGGGGQVAYAPQGPSDAAIQAGAAVTMGQQQLSGQGQQLQAAIAAKQLDNATSVTIAGLEAGVAHFQTEQAANVQSLGIVATRDVNMAGITSQTQIALANDAVQALHDQLATEVTKVGYQEQTKQLGIVTQGYTDITRSNNDALTSINTSHDQASVVMNRDNNNAYVATAVPLAQIDQKKAEVDRFYDYKQSKRGGGLLGNIIGGIASAFAF